MSLGLTGPHNWDELLFNRTKIERLRLHETDQFDLRDRSPCSPPGRIDLRAKLTFRRRENFAGRLRENLTGHRGKNVTGDYVRVVSRDSRDFASNSGKSRHNLRITRTHGRVSRALYSCSSG